MNITKIQTDLLKLLIKEDKNVAFGEEVNGLIPVTDGFFAALIPKSKLFLSFGSREPSKTLTKIFKEPEKLDFQIANEAETMTYDRHVLQKFVTADGRQHSWIDTKYMKYFDKNANYYVYNRIYPVFVMEDDCIVGLILPVNMGEGSGTE